MAHIEKGGIVYSNNSRPDCACRCPQQSSEERPRRTQPYRAQRAAQTKETEPRRLTSRQTRAARRRRQAQKEREKERGKLSSGLRGLHTIPNRSSWSWTPRSLTDGAMAMMMMMIMVLNTGGRKWGGGSVLTEVDQRPSFIFNIAYLRKNVRESTPLSDFPLSAPF